MQLVRCVQNAAEAAQVLQEGNAVLGLSSTLPASLSSSHLPPASMLSCNSCAPNSYKGVPPSSNSNSNSKTTHRQKPASKRLHLALPCSELDAEVQLPPKRKKCTPLPASTHQPLHAEDQVLTGPQTDQPHDHILHSKQHPEHTDHANSHYRPCKENGVMMSKHAELQHPSTEELRSKLRRLSRLNQSCMKSLPDGGQKLITMRQQLQDELDNRVAGLQSKQPSLCAEEHHRLAKPSSQTTAPAPTSLACHGKNLVDLSGPRAHVCSVHIVKPQSEAQLVGSPLTAQTPSFRPEIWEASEVLSEQNQVEFGSDATPGHVSDQAGNSATLTVSPPAIVTQAQHNMVAGLIYHFAARKGPSWLF